MTRTVATDGGAEDERRTGTHPSRSTVRARWGRAGRRGRRSRGPRTRGPSAARATGDRPPRSSRDNGARAGGAGVSAARRRTGRDLEQIRARAVTTCVPRRLQRGSRPIHRRDPARRNPSCPHPRTRGCSACTYHLVRAAEHPDIRSGGVLDQFFPTSARRRSAIRSEMAAWSGSGSVRPTPA
jgi:hypothetical protein